METAVALVLVVGAGLLVRSLWNASRVDPGFRAGNVLTFRTGMPPAHYTNQAEYVRFFREVGERLEALPGVRRAGGVSLLPASGYESIGVLELEGRPVKGIYESPHAQITAVTPGGLEALGCRLVQGRWLNESDTAKSLPVALVDEAFAEAYFPGESALLKRVRPVALEGTEKTNAWVTIVGVVGRMTAHYQAAAPLPVFYRPHSQSSTAFLSMVVQTDGLRRGLAREVSAAVLGVNREIPIYSVQTMEEVVRRAQWDKRFFGGIFVGLALLALFLALLGTYGLMAYVVSMRTRELGVRLALGATVWDVLGLVLGQGLSWVGVGLVAGVAAALPLAGLLRGYLFGVVPRDPYTLVMAIVGLGLAGVGACLVPALRATRIDPLTALRAD